MPSDLETTCPSCGQPVLEIDVRCKACGTSLNSTGSQRMIGQVVLGQYELVDVLGQGGMSVVYQGRHRITDQQVALKILPPELAAHAQVKSRFLEEAKALAQLDHPNIVHLYNFGQENGSFVLAMQFVIGKTWERMIVESERLSWQQTTRIGIDVLRALEYAHGRGVIHRDMKPSNVLVRELDGAATVMDFGIAKMTTSSRLTATGQTMGTVRYMSPEQVRGQEVDASTDLYSLGATMYESLVGETPFEGSTHFDIMSKHLTDPPVPPSQHGVAMPVELERALMRCLAKKPKDRFANARDVRKLLEAVLRDHGGELSETQRVSRELVQEAPSRPGALGERAGMAPTAPLGTPEPFASGGASSSGGGLAGLIELADSLEGRAGRGAANARGAATAGGELAASSSRSRRWAVAAAVLTLAAAGVAAVAITRDRGTKARRPPPLWEPEVGALTQEQRFPELGILVRTPEAVAPEAVAAAFRETWGAFAAFAQARGITEAPTQAVQVLAVVPRAALCKRSTYSGIEPPAECMTAVHAFRSVDATLVVVDEAAEWPRAMGLGIPEAACTASKDSRFCDLAAKFALEADGSDHPGGGSGGGKQGSDGGVDGTKGGSGDGGKGSGSGGAPKGGAKSSGTPGKGK